MVVSCCIVNCTNRAQKGNKQRFYRIPKVIQHLGEQTKDLTERRRAKWLSRINRKDWYPSDHDRVCSDHFLSGKPSSDHLDHDWAPSLKLGYDLDCTDMFKTRERHERLKARCERRHELNDANRMD
ncbi:PREDICTED: THAP domain-containing protein 5-like [Amphimedon queenslandica]|uniref:THAP-type domain-containing protein n=1 Tax=Amphimedon queenslandica TaxID=400682 RepID=A0A1X7VNN5_AMPQE|nr:PREDICTED: THAP domain-containing protein 5-like [Amphimedon queenslandica]|eukprot:XP_019861511.1 PREDICTED: THAP domain-containing protein 5-like [Amphimedon queenslandica]